MMEAGESSIPGIAELEVRWICFPELVWLNHRMGNISSNIPIARCFRLRKVKAPDAMGIAGGSVLVVTLPSGEKEWRFYYTGCPTLGDDVFLDQQKQICLAVSQDGIRWEKRGAVMLRNPQHDYENIAVAGPVVQQRAEGDFVMWYSAIGTRWG